MNDEVKQEVHQAIQSIAAGGCFNLWDGADPSCRSCMIKDRCKQSTQKKNLQAVPAMNTHAVATNVAQAAENKSKIVIPASVKAQAASVTPTPVPVIAAAPKVEPVKAEFIDPITEHQFANGALLETMRNRWGNPDASECRPGIIQYRFTEKTSQSAYVVLIIKATHKIACGSTKHTEKIKFDALTVDQIDGLLAQLG